MNKELIARLLDHDTTLWSTSPEIQSQILGRLGWLDVVSTFSDKIAKIQEFESNIPYPHVVLLGMGGSSLVSEVFLQNIQAPKRSLFILDTTDAKKIANVFQKIDPSKTLFIVASKSGTTLEVESLFAYFWDRVPRPQQYIAITDQGTPLEKLSINKGFRHAFINPTDIGGRFSALSYFGLVPLSLLGADLHVFWKEVQKAWAPNAKAFHEGLDLAHTLFTAHQKSIHKLLLSTSSTNRALALWIEQLIAESTGKQNKGFLPISSGEKNRTIEDALCIELPQIQKVHELASHFITWMTATALVGHLLEINPFDEPHVNTTKKNTASYLQRNEPTQEIQKSISAITSTTDQIATFLMDVKPDEVICILSYLPESNESHKFLDTLESSLLEKTHSVVVTHGPRYLHSTGQFHKGGKDIGRYILITENQPSPTIPGQKYDFNTLKLAQALGDYEALLQAGRKTLLVHRK
ncbi:MAG: hypothetical protein KDD46_08500 [Bdellovibrionales bacterium]|nr:hypothetical protein [Bdellovibrionales bacterium]